MDHLIYLIREDRYKTIDEVCSGVVSVPTYKRIENEVGTARFNVLLKLLNNLDVAFDEFSYIFLKNNENSQISRDYNVKLIRSIKSTINTQELYKLLQSYQDKDNIYYNTLQCIYNLHNETIQQAEIYANHVWNKLKEFDTLYAYDLFCLTHIFMAFNVEHLKPITNQIKKNLVYWRDFQNFSSVEITFYINLGRYLEYLGEHDEAVENYRNALNLSLEYDLATYASVTMMRLGNITSDVKLVKDGSNILKIFNMDMYNAIVDDMGLQF